MRYVIGGGLLWLVSQSLLTWPVPFAWELGIGVTEWGHWLAVVCLGIALMMGRRRETALVALAALIALLPVARALAQGPVSLAQLFTGVPVGPYRVETLEYAPGRKLDLYLPAEAEPGKTCIVSVHGGAWARGNRTEFAGLNGYLASRGYPLASVDYRLAPEFKFPTQLEDLSSARDFLKQRGFERFVWLGRSAGGHLAMLACFRHRDVGVVNFYGPSDMVWSYEHPGNPMVLDTSQAIRDFLGGTPEDRLDVFMQASPLCAPDPLPPVLILHGGRDDIVYLEQSLTMQKSRGARLVIYPWANHGFDVNFSGPSGQLSTREVESFLQSSLRTAPGRP